jgi:hypothetical protein
MPFKKKCKIIQPPVNLNVFATSISSYFYDIEKGKRKPWFNFLLRLYLTGNFPSHEINIATEDTEVTERVLISWFSGESAFSWGTAMKITKKLTTKLQ